MVVSCSFTFGEANYNSLPCRSKTNHERSTGLSDIKEIDWAAHHVAVNLSHDDLVQRPEVDNDKLGDGHYIAALIAQIAET
jgi:hypothetical protein